MSRHRVINFYRTGEPFGEFSNFADFPIQLKDREWPTTEHYFQAQKFAGTRHEEAIRLAGSPSAAARMGRERSRPLRRDWESVKDDIMREAVLAKFEQHPDLLSLLLSTGDAEIVEHTRNDSYWGDGGDGSGLNVLGRILVEIRERLRRMQTSSGVDMQESTHDKREALREVGTSMACRGSAELEGAIDVLGAYAAPPGPDSGWRIRIISPTSDRLEIRMFNISPDGDEALAVHATYQRE